MTQNLPIPPARIFFVGIGGIGMSGLAQLLVSQGYDVAGSDRGLQEAGKAELYACLRSQGIRLYAQDGSGVLAERPAALIVSTAVEEGNPDLDAILGLPVIHRARALSQALAATGAKLIGVAGSCGKTSVTGWIASALHALGERVLVVNGGYYSRCIKPGYPGNFMSDANPAWAVAEIDESDRSIAEFSPDYGILLNVGNDHYGEAELRMVFAAFLSRCKSGAATSWDLRELAESAGCPVGFFSASPAENACHPLNYRTDSDGIFFEANGFGQVHSSQSGWHSACNAAAVLALLNMLGLKAAPAELAASLAAFSGIRQRFEIMCRNAGGIPFVNDYAHNPEKLSAAISTARERFGSPLVAFFQPHGFKPLRFMREKLVDDLCRVLKPGDTFCLLPVFYAGGTATFSPSSDEVASELAQHHEMQGVHIRACRREEAEAIIGSSPEAACILVMGARDSSLRPWTASLGGSYEYRK